MAGHIVTARNFASRESTSNLGKILRCLECWQRLTAVQIRDKLGMSSTAVSIYLGELRRRGQVHSARLGGRKDPTKLWIIGPAQDGPTEVEPVVVRAKGDVRQVIVRHTGGVGRRDPLVAALFGVRR